MDALPWFWIWVVLAAVLCVGEMFTLSFFLLPFAIGAVIAAVANLVGADLLWQWAIFVVASVIALAALRPVANRVTRETGMRTGSDRLVGVVGEVIEGSPPNGMLRVRADREEWNAQLEGASPEPSQAPDVGAAVEVVAIEGTRLIVRLLPVDAHARPQGAMP
jgi:membrane protein implicated in regulation of membrane protease activity